MEGFRNQSFEKGITAVCAVIRGEFPALLLMEALTVPGGSVTNPTAAQH